MYYSEASHVGGNCLGQYKSIFVTGEKKTYKSGIQTHDLHDALPTEIFSPMLAVSLLCQYFSQGGGIQKWHTTRSHTQVYDAAWEVTVRWLSGDATFYKVISSNEPQGKTDWVNWKTTDNLQRVFDFIIKENSKQIQEKEVRKIHIYLYCLFRPLLYF